MRTPNLTISGKTVLVTGAAGFIGAALVSDLLCTSSAARIVGVDNVNDYYDISLKEHRLANLEKLAKSTKTEWVFRRENIADRQSVEQIFRAYSPSVVIHLAAQAGVRYSVTHPEVYIESNLIGFFNILEACRHSREGGHPPVEHLVYASSSSVYGANTKIPYATDDPTDSPMSLYAATKKSNELLAHAYASLYGIPATGLRFFTVYGPAGRPDMAYFSFTEKLRRGETIRIFNYGKCERDFTYVDDVVECVKRIMPCAPERGEGGHPQVPCTVYNIGNSHPENLLEFVTVLQEELIRAGLLPADFDFAAHRQLVPMQPGDVPVTYADTGALERDFGFTPHMSLREGLRRFVQWYKDCYITEIKDCKRNP